jgi:hypothetical protein
MDLESNVVMECINEYKDGVVGVIVPEESFGVGFWSKCKALERSFYVGVPWIEAARFFKKDLYVKLGGYNESLVSGEDWDLSQRVSKLGKISRTKSYIRHNEGELKLFKTLNKKYYYAKHFKKYLQQSESKNIDNQTSVVQRYWLFFSKPAKLFKNPILGIGMLVMKTCEFASGFLGLILN